MLDVNVLIRAHRPDLDSGARTVDWLESALAHQEPVAIWDAVLVSAYRVLTLSKLARTPGASENAMTFLEEVRGASVVIRTGERHWQLVRQLVESSHATGNLVTDAAIAAVAIEHRCRLASYDRDFAKFPTLQWFEPRVTH